METSKIKDVWFEIKSWVKMPGTLWIIFSTQKPKKVYDFMNDNYGGRSRGKLSYRFSMWLLRKRF